MAHVLTLTEYDTSEDAEYESWMLLEEVQPEIDPSADAPTDAPMHEPYDPEAAALEALAAAGIVLD